MQYFTLSKQQVFDEFKATDKGLDSKQADERLKKYGRNELIRKKENKILKILIGQFANFIVYILIIAFVISFLLGEYLDASVIGAIIILNALLGFVQEFKADKAIEALKKMSTLTCVVIRDGKKQQLDSHLLVPGDIVILEAGATVPADCYLLKDVELQVDESSLTGESVPVNKEPQVLGEDTPLSDRTNMLFSSSIVVSGKAVSIVVKTGMKTEIGRIAGIIQKSENKETPLQKKLSKFGIKLGILVLVLCLVIFLTGYIIGYPLLEMFLIAVSLAVAAIPEGLPAVVTICLAIGVQRMIKRNVLIRKLSAVETLGSTTVICSDKTGTLTRNEMTVQKIYANGKQIDVSGKGYDLKGQFTLNKKKFDPKEIKALIETSVLCNDASLVDQSFLGDPTEIALLVVGQKADIYPQFKRVAEKTFTSEDKYMNTVNEVAGKRVLHLKGATEIILKKCQRIQTADGIEKLEKKHFDEVQKISDQYSANALRVLGFAYSPDGKEDNLIFLGLMGMIDPPRDGVKEAILLSKQAGIRVAMITGDHKLTAIAIGKKVGIEGNAISGEEIEAMSEKNFARIINRTSIYARVSPEHKVKILEAYKKKNNIVAMTGDGVNDAPALKMADIGVAVNSGTDVSKEAADMILTDNHFRSIVNAVEEGRHIFTNIRKFVRFLLSCNLGELLTIFFGVILGLGVPLVAVQILWMNLVTDGLPALALSAEPLSHRVMRRPPRNPKEAIMNRSALLEMFFVGTVMTIITLLIFKFYSGNMIYAQTMAFTSLVMLQLFNSYNNRSGGSVFKINPFSNWKLLLAILISFGLQVLVIYTPMSIFFKTAALSLKDFGLLIATSLVIIAGMEVWKFVRSKVFNQKGIYKY
ncbi:cation-translocating P-type ATPase [Candidatus Kuenenbacteria bacterium]|nr:cation-translocating P-type ATPase [Candidatus Kuenenbacteria bacterium]